MKRHQSGRHFQRLLCARHRVVAGGCPHPEELAAGDGTVTAQVMRPTVGKARGPVEALRTGCLGEAKLELGLGRGAQDLLGGLFL